jgi:hypothetical protein
VHIAGVVRFLSFGVLGNEPVRMWCDNDAAVLAGSDATSIKRLAYIARRVRFLQELVVRGIVRMLDLPGTANPADMFTKHLAKALKGGAARSSDCEEQTLCQMTTKNAPRGQRAHAPTIRGRSAPTGRGHAHYCHSTPPHALCQGPRKGVTRGRS